ncbi:SpoIIE family protein phosphatase [Kitasatospora sp. NPDC001159]
MGLAVMDTDLRYVWLNTALERRGGVPIQDRIGRRVEEVLPGLASEDVSDRMHQVLQTGTPLIDFEYHGTTPAAPDQEVALSASFFRLQDSAEHVIGIGYAVIDVTDRHRTRQGLRLLNEAGRRLGNTLDISWTARELADIAVPTLADIATIDVVDAFALHSPTEPRPYQAGQEAGTSFLLHRVAVSRQTVTTGAPGHLSQPITPTSDSPQTRALTELRPVLVSQPAGPTTGMGAGNDPMARCSHLAVPLAVRGQILGVATYVRLPGREPFDPNDVQLARELTDRAAVCMDNSVRFDKERTAALTLQRSLLPSEVPEQNAVDVAHLYVPAERQAKVGGCWYDVIPLSGARIALVIGQVGGHGLHAAAAMGRLRTAVRTLARKDLSPQELLADLDDLVASLDREGSPLSASDLHGSTCLYAVYDPISSCCTLASAGHPAPVCLLPDRTASFLDLPSNPALGLADGLPFETADVTLPEGSLLALYTAALLTPDQPPLPPSEQRRANGSRQGARERLLRALAHSGCSPEVACRTVTTELLSDHPADDVALLVARTHTLAAEHVAEWQVSDDPALLAEVRAKAAARVAEWGLVEDAFITELVVSELVTNAIKYGQPPIWLRVIRDRKLICEVFDSSDTSPHVRRATADDEGGRGLFLVARLAGRWGTRYTARGKIVWSEQPLSPG